VPSKLESGRIGKSKSKTVSLWLFVKKKDGGTRVCLDYRRINEATVKKFYPLLLIDQIIQNLAGMRWFSKIDLRDAYNQIHMKKGHMSQLPSSASWGPSNILSYCLDCATHLQSFKDA
jgi:hypothetical protein